MIINRKIRKILRIFRILNYFTISTLKHSDHLIPILNSTRDIRRFSALKIDEK